MVVTLCLFALLATNLAVVASIFSSTALDVTTSTTAYSVIFLATLLLARELPLLTARDRRAGGVLLMASLALEYDAALTLWPLGVDLLRPVAQLVFLIDRAPMWLIIHVGFFMFFAATGIILVCDFSWSQMTRFFWGLVVSFPLIFLLGALVPYDRLVYLQVSISLILIANAHWWVPFVLVVGGLVLIRFVLIRYGAAIWQWLRDQWDTAGIACSIAAGLLLQSGAVDKTTAEPLQHALLVVLYSQGMAFYVRRGWFFAEGQFLPMTKFLIGLFVVVTLSALASGVFRVLGVAAFILFVLLTIGALEWFPVVVNGIVRRFVR